MKSATAIAFDYRPSCWLVAAIALMAVLAVAAIALSGIPSWIRIFGAIAAVACAGFSLGRYLRPLVRRAAWQQGGHWHVADAGGREFTAELIRGVARGAWIVLNLRRSDGRHLALILGPGNCTADTRRQLRVRLARIESAA
ncbi:MAG TPA: protein YgfX [Rudaea sp.]|nr:protein YgfX [Rudaea sp.]